MNKSSADTSLRLPLGQRRRWQSLKAFLVLMVGCLPFQIQAVWAHEPAHQVRHKASTQRTATKPTQRRLAKKDKKVVSPQHKTLPQSPKTSDHKIAASTRGHHNVQQGKASYYGGAALEGRLTASGERFSQKELTAAHPSLPFGTRVRVTNLSNQRQVVVRVNDRGPFVKGRIIDVSTAAAQQMKMTGQGVASVRIEVLESKEVALSSSMARKSPVS